MGPPPTVSPDRAVVTAFLEELAHEEKTRVLGWRGVPIDPAGLGADA